MVNITDVKQILQFAIDAEIKVFLEIKTRYLIQRNAA